MLHAGTHFWIHSFTSLKGGFFPKIKNSVTKMPWFPHEEISIKTSPKGVFGPIPRLGIFSI
jgi:hypothetical protein